MKKPVYDEGADQVLARAAYSFKYYLEKSGQKKSMEELIREYNFKRVDDGCIITSKSGLKGAVMYAISWKDKETLWQFPSSVPPRRVAEALSKDNPEGEWMSWSQSKLIKKIEL